MLIIFDDWLKIPTVGEVMKIRKDGRRKIIYVSPGPGVEHFGTKADFIKENGRMADRKGLVELFNETALEMAEVSYLLEAKAEKKCALGEKK